MSKRLQCALVLQHWCMKKLWENIKLVETLDCVACPLKSSKMCTLKSSSIKIISVPCLYFRPTAYTQCSIPMTSTKNPTQNQNLFMNKVGISITLAFRQTLSSRLVDKMTLFDKIEVLGLIHLKRSFNFFDNHTCIQNTNLELKPSNVITLL